MGAASSSSPSTDVRCPLSGFAEEAIRQSAPRALLAAHAATAGMVDAGRAWATALSLASLQRRREHFAEPAGRFPGEAVTVYDRGAEYLAELARQHPAFAAALREAVSEAEARVGAWEAAQAAAEARARRWVEARAGGLRGPGGWRLGRELALCALRSHGARVHASTSLPPPPPRGCPSHHHSGR